MDLVEVFEDGGESLRLAVGARLPGRGHDEVVDPAGQGAAPGLEAGRAAGSGVGGGEAVRRSGQRKEKIHAGGAVLGGLEAPEPVKFALGGAEDLHVDAAVGEQTLRQPGGDGGILASGRPVDATGAGDTYAAGFLYADALGLPLKACGEIGSVIAAKVVEMIGTKIDIPRWRDAKQQMRELIASYTR